MTNKKLKLAAMSVALTACVAAQPMAAHAVEGPDSVEDNAAPQAEPAPVEGKTAEGEVEGEEKKQEELTSTTIALVAQLRKVGYSLSEELLHAINQLYPTQQMMILQVMKEHFEKQLITKNIDS